MGWKTVAVNVSDIAAMGALPAKAVSTLCLPPSTEMDFVEGFIDGSVEAAAAYELDLVGGDISSSSQIMAGMALLGSVQAEPWLRSGASPGDALCVTGSLGGARTGLEELRADADASGSAVDRHLRPRPRLSEAQALRSVRVSAAIDVSDGLVIDLGRLMRASETGCAIQREDIPVDPAASDLEAALFGGEDFELLLAIHEADLQAAVAALEGCGTTLSRIGSVTDGVAALDGEPLETMEGRAWDHLRSR